MMAMTSEMPSSSSSKPASLREGKGDMKPLHPHSIPPLPLSSAMDDENRRETENSLSTCGAEDTDRKPASSSGKANASANAPQSRSFLHRDPLQSVSGSTARNSPSPQLLSQTYSRGNKRRVLRYGETLDSLFCLANDTPYAHRRLCQDIADGPSADDPASWSRVLTVASSKILGSEEEASERGADLIRLHRRATSRFSRFSEHSDSAKEEDILALWLSYAGVQSFFGSAEEARLTFRHVQNQRLGEKLASFYLCLAEFEEKQNDMERAKDTLRKGMDIGAEPRHSLKDAMDVLGSKGGVAKRESVRKNSLSPVRIAAKAAAGIPPLPTARSPTAPPSNKRKSQDDTSPKRTNAPTVSMNPVGNDAMSDDQTSGTGNLTPLDRMEARRPRVRPATNDVSETRSASKAMEKKPEMLIKNALNPLRESSALNPLSLTSTKSTQGRPPLLTKTPRLSRAGLSGKAQRVDPDQSLHADSEDDSSMDTASRSETLDVSSLLENVTDHPDVTKPKKVPKLNLDYMMNWDPNSRPGTSASSSTASKDQAPSLPPSRASMTGRARTPSMDKIEEASIGDASSVQASTAASAASASSIVTASMHSNTHRSDGSNESHQSAANGNDHSQVAVSGKSDADSHAAALSTRNAAESSADMAALVSKSNREFLPLVCESNILRVNSVPYAKLGVIGKGGSCKVYRALSKDCSIVAIKKVKLGGMDKKAINGYANEIALLKRLRGNPAIIQMYDSEVDLSRKAIFVVMELGEVDLNQVIQQQTLHDKQKEDERSRSALDMNFIRLTFQQMLKAVHCIHEERIIHGDLKPANFLFVRGALKLIDFGIAKAIQSDDTTNIYRDSQIGTLNYMSPEAILDTGSGMNGARMRIGRASDIWSLGCILYQMVYGKTPFAELHMIQKLHAIVNPNYKISFPKGVEDFGAVDAIQLCLRRTPEDRPPIVGPNGLLNEHCFLNS